MNPGSPGQIITLIVLVFVSAFFSAAETALTSLSKIRLRNLLDEKVKKAEKVSILVENPNKLLSAILIGNNIANIMASSIATILAMSLIKNQDLAVAISTAIMTIIILVLAEITPKTFAAQNSEKISFLVVDIVQIIVFILTPFIWIINFFVMFFIKILGGDTNKTSPMITEAELKTMVNVSHQEGVLETEEREMINNVFDFGDSKAKDVMTPRPDIVAVEENISYMELMNIFKEENYSRIPVYKENVDNMIGILHLKDLIFYENKENFTVTDIIREPYFTYEYKGTNELFKNMRSLKVQIAIVLDEYGSTAGLLTIEDLVEEIVGEINDEYDEDEADIEVIQEDEYIVDGSTRLEDVNEMLGISLESEDFDTIGGYLIGLIGRFPEANERIENNHITFVIEEIDKNRIEKIRIHT